MYPFTMDELEELFSRFNFLSFDLQILSDQECVALFGNDNRCMYEINKAKLLARDKDAEGLNPIEADSYFNGVSSLSQNESVGILDLLKKKLDIVNIRENGTLYESSLTDDGLEDIDNAIHLKRTANDAVPEFTPYLIPTEIEQLVGDGSGLSSDEKGFLELYKKNLVEGMKNFDSKKYFDTIKSLYEEKQKCQSESQTYVIDMRMEACGWNPNLPFNERSFVGARNRVSNYINEFYNPTIVDVTTFTEAEDYNDPTLDDRATFAAQGVICLIDTGSAKYITFRPQAEYWYSRDVDLVNSKSIDPEQHITMYMVIVPENVKRAIHTQLVTYGTANIEEFLNSFLPTDSEKVICAKFLTGLASNILDGKAEMAPGAKVYKIFDNEWGQFRIPEIERLVTDIKMNKPGIGQILAAFTISEAVMKLHENYSVAYLKNMRCKDTEIEGYKILREMQDLVTPQMALTEAKNIPVRINDKGVVVDLPTLVEEEYQTVHKAILVYDQEENYEAMKDSLAHLWYLNLLCERKITKWKDKEKKQQQLKIRRDLRARILNDFKKYLKKVIEHMV